MARVTCNRRRLEYWVAFAMSSWLMRTARQLSTGICMLDCPEASQTSPTSTFCSTTGSPSETVTLYFLKLPLGVSIFTDHLPSGPAVAR